MNERLTVGICTYRRDGVANTVRSIFVQTRRPDDILVIDNDDQPTAKDLIETLRSETDIPIRYVHIPGSSNAIARNGVLDHAKPGLLAWIDDDEVAAPDWLDQLVASWSSLRGLAAVFGPQDPVYEGSAPFWMRMMGPHAGRRFTIDGEIKAGSTGNCLMDLRHPAFDQLRFNEDLRPFGGEDTQFFMDAYRQGARYAFTDAPRVRETVFRERATMRWLMRRKFRQGMIYVRAADKYGLGPTMVAGAKLGWFLLASAFCSLQSVAWRQLLLRGALQAGIIVAGLGFGPKRLPPKKAKA